MRKHLITRAFALGLAGLLTFGLAGCGQAASEKTVQEQTTAAAAAQAEEKADSKKDGAEKKDAAEKAEESKAEETKAEETKAEEPVKKAETIEVPKFAGDEFPVIDGSTATLPLGRMIYRMSQGATEKEAEDAIQFTKTTNSYIRLMDGEVDLIISYEAGEAAKNRMEYDNLEIKPIGLDALIFLCNEKNPVQSLTTKQIQDIYSGKITNWKKVGGENKDIVAFQRPVNSGSQTLMQNLMMKNIPMADAPGEYRPGEMGDLVESVADYNNEANAIGYSVYYYANNMYMLPGLRFMAVDDVMPDNDTIRTGTYQYVNPFYAAIRKDTDKKSDAYQLFDWLTGEDGQSLINELGYVSVKEGTKVLPDEFSQKYASIKTGKRRLVVDARMYDGSAGIVVFGEDMHPEAWYKDVLVPRAFQRSIGNMIPAMMRKESEPIGPGVGMGEFAHEDWGIFNIADGTWEVEPTYDFVVCDWIATEADVDGAILYFGYYPEWSETPKDEVIFAINAKGESVDVSHMKSEDLPYGPHFDERYYQYYASEMTGEDEYTYRVGKDGSYIGRGWEAHNDELILHGKTVELLDDSGIMPYMSVNDDEQFPAGWTQVNTYSMDEDYNTTEYRTLLIDENSDIRVTLDSMDPYIRIAAEDYYVVTEHDHNMIRNYDGETIFEWYYAEFDVDYDWNYVNTDYSAEFGTTAE